LHRWVSDGAAHDSVQHAAVCHPDTRKTIIGEIMSWIEDPSRTSRVLWFNGPAGAGKTAIAHSLCKLCVAAQWLAGTFFFSRYASASGRSNAEFLFPTISFGLSLAIPDVGKIIDAVVAQDPSIPTKALEIQLQKLILEPLQQISEESKQKIVIIIDGLDECEGEDVQSNILRLLGSVFQRPSVGGCDRICFIVTSRPEPWIRDEFNIEPLSSITRQIFLGQTSEADDDIRTFLRLGFTEIHDSPKHRLTMSNVAKPWPSYRVLDDLVDKASGQFVYPATVLKFVGDPNFRPTDRLDIITSIPVISPSALATKPLATLDLLYSQILSMSSDKQRTIEIFIALIAMKESISRPLVAWRTVHLDLLIITEKLLGLQPGDGSQALRMIHSLIHIPGRSLMSDVADDNLSLLEVHYQDEDEDEIRFHHKSFIDYLLDPSRSLEYCVELKEMNTRLTLACIVTMQTFSLQPRLSRIACSTFPLSFTYNIFKPSHLIPHVVTWGYATLCWTDLITNSGIPPQTLLQALLSFDLFGCYLDTLDPKKIDPECQDTINRLAFPSRPDTVISKISENL
jgi:NACHT domain